MARFLTQEWIDEFNAALDGVVLEHPGTNDEHATGKRDFVVVEEVHDAPDGDLRVTLHADGGRLRLSRADPPGSGDSSDGGSRDDEGADVTIVLCYRDAVALSAGELTPAEAVGAGRIRVRGDLAVLASAHSMLDAARERTAGVSATTTY
jgi:hypothetical protein